MLIMKTEEIVNSPNMQEIAQLPYEISLVLYIKDNRIIALEGYYIGDAHGVQLPKLSDVVTGCLINKTNKVIFVHNHPYVQGRCSAKPSGLDLATTKRYNKWLSKAGVELLDHIILSPEGYYSFLEHKKIIAPNSIHFNKVGSLLSLVNRYISRLKIIWD